jgi:hypothetical protein
MPSPKAMDICFSSLSISLLDSAREAAMVRELLGAWCPLLGALAGVQIHVREGTSKGAEHPSEGKGMGLQMNTHTYAEIVLQWCPSRQPTAHEAGSHECDVKRGGLEGMIRSVAFFLHKCDIVAWVSKT